MEGMMYSEVWLTIFFDNLAQPNAKLSLQSQSACISPGFPPSQKKRLTFQLNTKSPPNLTQQKIGECPPT